MNQDPFVHQHLPHSHRLAPGLHAFILLQQPVDELLPGATLSVTHIQYGLVKSFCRDLLAAEAHCRRDTPRCWLPVGFEVMLPVSDQSRVPLHHDAVQRPRGLDDAV